MPTNDLQQYDIGTVLRFTITEDGEIADISGATIKTLKLRTPQTRVVKEFTMSFTTDGTDGQVEYITQENDLDDHGIWKAQVYLEFPSGKWHTSTVNMVVGDNVD